MASRSTTYAAIEVETDDEAHEATCAQCLEETDLGQLVKTVSLAGSDGVYLCIGIVCGATGASFSTRHVLILGFSGLLALSLGLAMNEFLSVRSHNRFLKAELTSHSRLFREHEAEEKSSVVDVMVSKGVSEADAETVVETLAKYENYFLEHVLLPIKIQQIVPSQEELESTSPLLAEAFAMFLSVLVVGSLPLFIALLTLISGCGGGDCATQTPQSVVKMIFAVSLLILFGLGASKSFFSGMSWLVLGVENVLVGLICGIAGYTAGSACSSLFS